MSVSGIDEITYGVEDLATSARFFADWGLAQVEASEDQVVFESLNGCRVIVAARDKPGLPPAIEEGSTLREVVWGVESEADLKLYAERIANDPGFIEGEGRIGCTDPNGLAVRLQVTRKRDIQVACGQSNTW